jgi:hypothetical protein
MKFEYKIAEEVAVNELKEFIEEVTVTEKSEEDIRDGYPRLIQALRFGFLVLPENSTDAPKYTLKEPVKSDTDTVVVSEITVQTRITLAVKKRLAVGLNPKKDQFEYGARTMAHMIQQPQGMIDKFGRFDNEVIEELVQVFL